MSRSHFGYPRIFVSALGSSLVIFRNNDFHEFLGFQVEESASHPLPLQEEVPQVGPGGVPPVGFPGTPLSYDISGSSSSNDLLSTLIHMIFSVDYDGINAISMRKRELLEHGHFLYPCRK